MREDDEDQYLTRRRNELDRIRESESHADDYDNDEDYYDYCHSEDPR